MNETGKDQWPEMSSPSVGSVLRQEWARTSGVALAWVLSLAWALACQPNIASTARMGLALSVILTTGLALGWPLIVALAMAWALSIILTACLALGAIWTLNLSIVLTILASTSTLRVALIARLALA